jgi:hypothetical protein
MARRESQYLNDYLRGNAERGPGNGLTVNTYLAYTLRGKAKQYSGRYADALLNSLRRSDAVCSSSKCHGQAWYPREMVEQKAAADPTCVLCEFGAEPGHEH